MTPYELDDVASALLDGLLSPDEAARALGDPAVATRVAQMRAARALVGEAPPVADDRREAALAAALTAAFGPEASDHSGPAAGDGVVSGWDEARRADGLPAATDPATATDDLPQDDLPQEGPGKAQKAARGPRAATWAPGEGDRGLRAVDGPWEGTGPAPDGAGARGRVRDPRWWASPRLLAAAAALLAAVAVGALAVGDGSRDEADESADATSVAEPGGSPRESGGSARGSGGGAQESPPPGDDGDSGAGDSGAAHRPNGEQGGADSAASPEAPGDAPPSEPGEAIEELALPAAHLGDFGTEDDLVAAIARASASQDTGATARSETARVIERCGGEAEAAAGAHDLAPSGLRPTGTATLAGRPVGTWVAGNGAEARAIVLDRSCDVVVDRALSP